MTFIEELTNWLEYDVDSGAFAERILSSNTFQKDILEVIVNIKFTDIEQKTPIPNLFLSLGGAYSLLDKLPSARVNKYAYL